MPRSEFALLMDTTYLVVFWSGQIKECTLQNDMFQWVLNSNDQTPKDHPSIRYHKPVRPGQPIIPGSPK